MLSNWVPLSIEPDQHSTTTLLVPQHMHVLIYTCPARCKSVHAQAIGGYLSIPEVSTAYCFCLAVKVLRFDICECLHLLKNFCGYQLHFLHLITNIHGKFFAVTKRSTKIAKFLCRKTKAIHGISMSHLVRVTLHCGRSWVIGELRGETNH